MKPSLQNDPVKYWLNEIAKEEKAHDVYRKQAKEAAEAARDESKNKAHQFNMHWANCRIIKSAIYANRPKSDVRRRYQKPDPEEKELARLVERALEYNMDTEDFETPSMAVVRDYVQVAMGVPRVVYEVTTQPIPDTVEPEIQILANMTGEEIPPTFEQGLEEVTSQAVGIEQVPYKHFHWEPGHSDWKNVNWVAIEVYMSRDAIQKQYEVKLDSAETAEESEREAQKYEDQIQLYEIFHKPSRRVYVVAKGHDEPLKNEPDELNLKGFYPFPRPAFDNLKSDEMIPKPDYQFVKNQIIELNRLSGRRKALVSYIKAVRIYDSRAADVITALESATDGANIPVTNMLEMLESAGSSAGFDRIIADLPMADRVNVVLQLTQQIESVKQEIYEILGISDIIRGTSQASETAAAQNLKGQWANVRLNDKTAEVNRLWRDVLRMMAEIICEHFDPAQLQLMTGITVTPRMAEMMKSDIGRSFAIDVETDSTILRDDQEERQQKLELVNTLLEKLGFVLPLVQQGVMPAELVQEIMLFIVSSHKHGKQLEDSIMGLGGQMGNLQNLQQLQQQLQEAQMQMQQMQQQAGQQIQQVTQQAGQQIQQLQGKLAQYNEREEQRKDFEVKLKAGETQAKVRKINTEAQAQDIENRVIGSKLIGEVEHTEAQTDQIYHNMSTPEVMNG